jgi:hypothetical protein
MRRQVASTVLVASLVLGAAFLARSARSGDDDGDDSRIKQGLAIAPVHLDLRGKNRSLVGLGSYIVNAQSGCQDCHSCPTYASGHNPYIGQPKLLNGANYLAGGVPFGPFTSRNITPDKDTGMPAGLTFAQFKEELRKGTDFDHAHPQFGPLLQVMPWPVYGDMTNHDIRAIYEFLRAIPHAEPGKCSDPGETAP